MGEALESASVSVIVPHFNDLANLDTCLSAISRQRNIEGYRVEVIVGDNDSPQGIDEVRRVAGDRAKVVHVAERGAGPARNAAVAHANGSLLAFTDSDCIPAAEWLAGGLKLVAKGRIVGGCMKVSVEDERDLSGPEAFERVFAFNNERYVRELGFTVTANLFCTREDFKHIGPFRTEVSEDKEWCNRARDAGIEILYTDDAVVSHPARRDWGALRAKWQRLDLETYNLLKDQKKSDFNWIAQAWVLPLSIVPHAIRCATSGNLERRRDRARAFGTLAQIRLWRFFDYHRILLNKRGFEI
ncbi:glycosyltransferase family 2 protein [Erythrobacter sp. SD-21]|uniref:glycosyltransferase family 2 protein n=1 Tax=Erythrobacter sp. SD-21 TaxID=161528 RepID=UPI000153F294|nr:glycosyltransferase [Erythrobacter sp. SD-21]EDL49301.1 glycosyl transferase, family 2 [Erythrobacter sp. SD-21]